MTTQAEQTKEEQTEQAKAEVLQQLSGIRETVAKAEAAKPLRDELIMKANALGVGATKIAEAAGVTRRMIYIHRDKAGANSAEG